MPISLVCSDMSLNRDSSLLYILSSNTPAFITFGMQSHITFLSTPLQSNFLHSQHYISVFRVSLYFGNLKVKTSQVPVGAHQTIRIIITDTDDIVSIAQSRNWY